MTTTNITPTMQAALDTMRADTNGRMYAYNGVSWNTIQALATRGLVRITRTAPLYSTPVTRRTWPKVIGTDWTAELA